MLAGMATLLGRPVAQRDMRAQAALAQDLHLPAAVVVVVA
jgi:hypothetical protein